MLPQDYEEFCAAFERHGVRCLVVGAHALAFHARPRATKDLDILIEPSLANARRALAALRDFFGGADLECTVADLADPHSVIQLGRAPVRIDLLSTLPGCPSFKRAWADRVEAPFGSVKVHYLGLDDLIRAKEAAGRAQDLADLRILRRARARAQPTKRASRRQGGSIRGQKHDT